MLAEGLKFLSVYEGLTTNLSSYKTPFRFFNKAVVYDKNSIFQAI